jgi:hypothetical protein
MLISGSRVVMLSASFCCLGRVCIEDSAFISGGTGYLGSPESGWRVCRRIWAESTGILLVILATITTEWLKYWERSQDLKKVKEKTEERNVKVVRDGSNMIIDSEVFLSSYFIFSPQLQADLHVPPPKL